MAVYNLREDDNNWGGDGGYTPPDPPPYISTPPDITGGYPSPKEGITDPPVTSTPNWEIPTNADGSQVGSGNPWASGSSAPSGAPAGYTWDPTYASYMPTPGTAATTTSAPTAASTPTTDTGWQIPTLPNGQQYGGASWAAGSDHPSQTPPGFVWDPKTASYQPIPGYTASTTTGPIDYSSDAGILKQIALWSKMPGADPALANDPQYFLRRIKETGGIADPSKLQFWQDATVGDKAFFRNPNRESGGIGAAYQTPAGGTYDPTNPFSDPATKNFIDLLNSRISSLLTPQQNPDLDSLAAYMRDYFKQLQSPVYTPAQQDTIATQQLDPLERQRQARKTQVIQHFASLGMSPSDGPTISALNDVDREFDGLRANAQSGIATNEINLGRDNQSKAVDVGGALASLIDGMNSKQDTRANTAVGLASQIPQLAQSRMATAISLLNGSNVNPAQLLSPLANFQQQGINQNSTDSAYWASIIGALAKAFGL